MSTGEAFVRWTEHPPPVSNVQRPPTTKSMDIGGLGKALLS